MAAAGFSAPPATTEASTSKSAVSSGFPIIKNQTTGGFGGQDWGNDMWKFERVSRIEIWYGQGWQIPQTVLKGIRITWGDGSIQQKGSLDGNLQYDEFTFGPSEGIRDMVISGAPSNSAGRADSIRFTTTWNRHFFAGGNGGAPTPQNVGNQSLIGFVGGSQGDIDRLGAVFNG